VHQGFLCPRRALRNKVRCRAMRADVAGQTSEDDRIVAHVASQEHDERPRPDSHENWLNKLVRCIESHRVATAVLMAVTMVGTIAASVWENTLESITEAALTVLILLGGEHKLIVSSWSILMEWRPAEAARLWIHDVVGIFDGVEQLECDEVPLATTSDGQKLAAVAAFNGASAASCPQPSCNALGKPCSSSVLQVLGAKLSSVEVPAAVYEAEIAADGISFDTIGHEQAQVSGDTPSQNLPFPLPAASATDSANTAAAAVSMVSAAPAFSPAATAPAANTEPDSTTSSTVPATTDLQKMAAAGTFIGVSAESRPEPPCKALDQSRLTFDMSCGDADEDEAEYFPDVPCDTVLQTLWDIPGSVVDVVADAAEVSCSFDVTPGELADLKTIHPAAGDGHFDLTCSEGMEKFGPVGDPTAQAATCEWQKVATATDFVVADDSGGAGGGGRISSGGGGSEAAQLGSNQGQPRYYAGCTCIEVASFFAT